MATEAKRKPAGRLLRVPEVAERLGVSVRMVIELLDDGSLPRVRLARRAVRVDELDVDALIESRKTRAG